MSEKEIQNIADQAQMVVGGYSFTKKGDAVSILNLSNPMFSMVIAMDGTMLETNMEPVEQALVLRYWKKNASFMEEDDA